MRVFVNKRVIPLLPGNEKYQLVSQMIRAARSTTANVAEGYGRFHFLDSAKFCSNARASAYEVLDHLITAKDESLIEENIYQEGRSKTEEAIKLLNGYVRYLQNKANETSP